MNSIKVACIQMDILNCEKETNIVKALTMAHVAVSEGAELLVFPEVFSTGFCYENMVDSAEHMPGETVKRMCDFSKEHECILIFSIIERKDGVKGPDYYNLGICIEDGEIAGLYRKTHPFKKEKQYFSAGNEIVPIRLMNRDLVIGLQICYEIRFPEVARKLALEGSDILVTIAEFPSPRGHIWKSLAIARAIENQIPHIACNRVGDGPDSSFFGGSIIVDALGEVKEEAGDKETVISHLLELEKTVNVRKTIPVFDDRRSDIY
ncbi:nitrilase-related carbon-nitrogen hydrolase [Methanolobus mangrovi]|uniref:Nitrilase-related carbon-nitrogen hydrolase n=1 Tax=Methanolobus mangrovi TaxID=3072977 RepID=A0AA51YFT5_9EURY|nr:nitrilase-related carbon-nitrogen hydrolase [Methanolobus mangrovi]WMW21271.1 nitrilase-related carbon-nitrogen hydrolase [Methanolobus mangrovi]